MTGHVLLAVAAAPRHRPINMKSLGKDARGNTTQGHMAHYNRRLLIPYLPISAQPSQNTHYFRSNRYGPLCTVFGRGGWCFPLPTMARLVPVNRMSQKRPFGMNAKQLKRYQARQLYTKTVQFTTGQCCQVWDAFAIDGCAYGGAMELSVTCEARTPRIMACLMLLSARGKLCLTFAPGSSGWNFPVACPRERAEYCICTSGYPVSHTCRTWRVL